MHLNMVAASQACINNAYRAFGHSGSYCLLLHMHLKWYLKARHALHSEGLLTVILVVTQRHIWTHKKPPTKNASVFRRLGCSRSPPTQYTYNIHALATDLKFLVREQFCFTMLSTNKQSFNPTLVHTQSLNISVCPGHLCISNGLVDTTSVQVAPSLSQTISSRKFTNSSNSLAFSPSSPPHQCIHDCSQSPSGSHTHHGS